MQADVHDLACDQQGDGEGVRPAGSIESHSRGYIRLRSGGPRVVRVEHMQINSVRAGGRRRSSHGWVTKFQNFPREPLWRPIATLRPLVYRPGSSAVGAAGKVRLQAKQHPPLIIRGEALRAGENK